MPGHAIHAHHEVATALQALHLEKLQDLERKIQILLKKAVVKPVHMEALSKVLGPVRCDDLDWDLDSASTPNGERLS